MSAYLVDQQHIDALVSIWIALGHRVNAPGLCPHPSYGDRLDRANQTGAMLWAANLLNIRYLYPRAEESIDAVIEANVNGYRYTACPIDRLRGLRPVLGVAYKVIRCYQYQSLDRDGWESSDACKLTESMIHSLESLTPGYIDAPWGVTNRDLFMPPASAVNGGK